MLLSEQPFTQLSLGITRRVLYIINMFHVLFKEHVDYDGMCSYSDLTTDEEEIAATDFSTLTAAKWYADSVTEFPKVASEFPSNYWTADVYWCPDNEEVLVPHHFPAINASYSHTEFYEDNLVCDVFEDDYIPAETILQFNNNLVSV